MHQSSTFMCKDELILMLLLLLPAQNVMVLGDSVSGLLDFEVRPSITRAHTHTHNTVSFSLKQNQTQYTKHTQACAHTHTNMHTTMHVFRDHVHA